MSDKPKPALQMVLYKRRNGQFAMAACRGIGKGCDKFQAQKKPTRPCEDCIRCDDMNETVESVLARVERGDA
jgi:hypothetical protein